jgi:hypothetical protein
MKKLPLNPYSFRIGLAFVYWLFELPLNVKITNLLLLLVLLLPILVANIIDAAIIVTVTKMTMINFLLFTIEAKIKMTLNMALF